MFKRVFCYSGKNKRFILLKLGLAFGNHNDEAIIVDIDHNDMPAIFRLCLNKDGRDSSDYPRETVIEIARNVIETFNVIQELKKVLR